MLTARFLNISNLEPRTSNLEPRTSNLEPRTLFFTNTPLSSLCSAKRLGVLCGENIL